MKAIEESLFFEVMEKTCEKHRKCLVLKKAINSAMEAGEAGFKLEPNLQMEIPRLKSFLQCEIFL